MAEINYHSGLRQTDKRIDSLYADFSGMENLERKIYDVLQRLKVQENVTKNVSYVRGGKMSMETFDGWFADLVRVELGKTLGIIRNKAVAKARASGAGSASSAVHRRMYRDAEMGNINIGDNRKRITRKERFVLPPMGGRSGKRRERYVSQRTIQLRKYYGPDRAFVLRFLNEGTPGDRIAQTFGPTGKGSKATWGERGHIAPRSFFNMMASDMEAAANELGTTLVGMVDKWVEQNFTE